MYQRQHARHSLGGAKSSIPGLVTGKPNMSVYTGWYSWKERRVEWEEEKVSIGNEG